MPYFRPFVNFIFIILSPWSVFFGFEQGGTPRLLLGWFSTAKSNLVRGRGLEPPRGNPHKPLKPVRLPVSPPAHETIYALRLLHEHFLQPFAVSVEEG